MKHYRYYLYAAIGIGLIAILIGCVANGGSGSGGGESTATALPTEAPPEPTEPVTTASPPTGITPAASNTPVAGDPATATPIPPTPTTIAGKPLFTFTPKSGAPGTQVSVSGWNFTPGETIAVLIGIPQPIGQPLATATVDAEGRWSTSVGIPPAMPSGETLVGKDLHLVVTDIDRVALTSAPFAFQAPSGPPVEAGVPTLRRFLEAYANGEDVRPFLARHLRDELAAGRPLDQTIGMHPIALEGFTIEGPAFPPAEALFVRATLNWPGFSEERTFILTPEGGEWKYGSSQLEATIPDDGNRTPVPTPEIDAVGAVDRFLSVVQGGTSLHGSQAYLIASLRRQVEAGQLDASMLLGLDAPFQVYTIDGTLGSGNPETRFVEVTLSTAGETVQRIFEVSTREDGNWLIFSVRPYNVP